MLEQASQSIEQKKVPVRRPWFEAWYEGNAIVPQTNIGILTTVINAILQQADFNVKEFSESELTEEQKKFISDMMSAMHAKKNVSLSTAEGARFFGSQPDNHKIVDISALENLWINIRTGVLEQFVFYKNRSYENASTGARLLEEVRAFMDDRNSENLKDLRVLAEFAHKLIKSDPDIKGLLQEYRERFRQPLPEGIRSSELWDRLYSSRYQELLRKKIAEQGISVQEDNLESFLKFFT